MRCWYCDRAVTSTEAHHGGHVLCDVCRTSSGAQALAAAVAAEQAKEAQAVARCVRAGQTKERVAIDECAPAEWDAARPAPVAAPAESDWERTRAMAEKAQGGVRDDSGKVDLTLVPREVLLLICPDLEALLDFWFKDDRAALEYAVRGGLAACAHGTDHDMGGVSAYAQILNKGALKYARFNWERGLHFSRFYNSALRHRLKALSAMNDDESGQPHMWHYSWNVNGLYVMVQRGRFDLDDRAALGIRPAPVKSGEAAE